MSLMTQNIFKAKLQNRLSHTKGKKCFYSSAQIRKDGRVQSKHKDSDAIVAVELLTLVGGEFTVPGFD